jgi:hypothetical protein
MSSGDYDAFDDPYCYKGTSVQRTVSVRVTPQLSRRSRQKSPSFGLKSRCRSDDSARLITGQSIIICSKTSIDRRGNTGQ